MVDRNAAAIADQLLALPSPDRARLAELLLASLEERDTDAEALWDSEIDRRSTELATGRVAGVAATDVFAEVERRLRR
jgi:putative addiction module component (TIGR02574 family)